MNSISLVWSNFEIADMDFWRSEAYMKYFEYLDSKGGFYYEVSRYSYSQLVSDRLVQRWGDAPVHSIGAALFARKDQIHFFKQIGYRHNPFQHCPQGDLHRKGKVCAPTMHPISILMVWQCWCLESENMNEQ